MVTRHQASECEFEVEDGWRDLTNYVYRLGVVTFHVERFGRASDASERVEGALRNFDRSATRHVVVERRLIETPFRGDFIAHRMASDGGLFEVIVVWAIGERSWLCRATAPLEAEDACRETIDKFLETYEPVEEP